MYAYILYPNLVVGDISISFNDFLYPVRHGLHQFFQVWRVVHPEDPQLLDLILQLVQVGGVCLLQLHLHPGPHILNRIEVRAVARPFDELDVRPRAREKIHHVFICQPNEKFSF